MVTTSGPGKTTASEAGPLLFARYAYPPNERGFCGPDDYPALLAYGAGATTDDGLRDLAMAFSGAWPYLELITEATGAADPLGHRVVEAYWVGNDLLDRVDMLRFGNSLRERFHARAGKGWGYLEEAIPARAVPHHSFHVFGVYPWVGLLASHRGPDPLHILDRCRIRWGEVVATLGDTALVRSRPLLWEDSTLRLGPAAVEQVTLAIDGTGLAGAVAPGDWVSMHWDWVCDRLSRRQLGNLVRYTRRQLHITNRRLAHPGPAIVLG